MYKGLQVFQSDYEPGGREFDETSAGRRTASPRSGDDPERSEGRAGEAHEQSRRAPTASSAPLRSAVACIRDTERLKGDANDTRPIVRQWISTFRGEI